MGLALRLGRPLTEPVVASALEQDGANLQRAGTEADLVEDVYHSLTAGYYLDEDSLGIMRETCGTWLQRRALNVGLGEAQIALSTGDFDKARALIGTGLYEVEAPDEPIDLLSNADYILAGSRFVRSDAVPTGLRELDRAWKGGIRPGEVGIVMGYTGLGKSMWLCMLAAAAFWSGRPVLYYTTELTREQIQTRIALGLVQRGLNDMPRDIGYAETLAAFAEEHGFEIGARADVRVSYVEGNITSIGKDLAAYKEEKGYYPGLLLIDSPIDLSPPTKFEKGYEGLRASYIWLRKLAQQTPIPIWTSVQTNREAVGRAKSRLKDVGDSFHMLQKAHYVIGLAKADAQGEEFDGTPQTAYVLKDSLHGQTGGKLEVRPHFGEGDNGWPGVEVVDNYGFTLPVRKED